MTTPQASDRDAILRRIEGMLDDLSVVVREAIHPPPAVATGAEGVRDYRADVSRVIKMREARGRYFPADWFSNPAWDLLLFLYDAHLNVTEVTVGDVGVGTDNRPTTTIRWLEILEAERIITRRRSELDSRRVYISLNDKGVEAMRAYFDSRAMFE